MPATGTPCGGRTSFWRLDKTYDLSDSQPLDLLREFALTRPSGQLRPKAAALLARHQDPKAGRPALEGCSGSNVQPGAYRVEAWVTEAGLGVRTEMVEPELDRLGQSSAIKNSSSRWTVTT